MKKVIIAVVAFSVLFSVNMAVAKTKPNGKPFQAIWKELERYEDFREQFALIQDWMREHHDDDDDGDDDGVIQRLVNAVRDLTTKVNTHIDGHTHATSTTPGPIGPQGPAGPQGPVGPQGPRGISGAGNIAFVDDEDGSLYALTTNRKVWERTTSTWSDLNRDVPTSTSKIVQWELTGFLDILGDIWNWNGSAWANVSHP